MSVECKSQKTGLLHMINRAVLHSLLGAQSMLRVQLNAQVERYNLYLLLAGINHRRDQ